MESLSISLILTEWRKNRKTLPDPYKVSETWPMGRRGVVDKLHTSEQDGRVMTITWTFESPEARNVFLSENSNIKDHLYEC